MDYENRVKIRRERGGSPMNQVFHTLGIVRKKTGRWEQDLDVKRFSERWRRERGYMVIPYSEKSVIQPQNSMLL